MRRKRHLTTDPLLDFGAMAVIEHAVGGQVVVTFGEMRALRRRLPGSGYARLGVDDDVGAGGQETRGHQRCQRQQRGRRITTRIRHDPGVGDRVALQFGEAVGHAARHLTGFRIPARARGGVPQPERTREIDHADTCFDERGSELGGDLVGQREKDQVGEGRESFGQKRHDVAVPDSGQRGQPARCGTCRA